MGANEQKFLLDKRLHDICLNREKVDHHGDTRGYLYVSDVLEMYLKASRAKVKPDFLEARGTCSNKLCGWNMQRYKTCGLLRCCPGRKK